MPTDPTAPVVVAVVVTHDGMTWLPGLLAALGRQTRAPDLVVGADTGSTDGSADRLAALPSIAAVARLAASTGYGDAVRAALQLSPTSPVDADRTWVWLLHDDCEPAPDALEMLLAATALDPRIGLAGPKVRSLDERGVLLEVGVTVARSGRRETLLERREIDQGQHDSARDVLAVGTAGMLVRRDVWETLGGLDPALPLLRDDVDLGWRAVLAGHRVVCVPQAVLWHAEATARGRRAGPLTRHPTRLDRRHGAYVLLANLPLPLLPPAVVTLVLGSLLRALGLLVARHPAAAADDLLGTGAALARPDRLVVSRAARRHTRTRPATTALRRLAPRSAGRRHLAEVVATAVGVGSSIRRGRHRSGAAAHGAESGPTAEGQENLPGPATGVVRRLLLRPSLGLLAALTLLALLATRGLLGDGRLMGGALLPAPEGAAQLWTDYTSTWHPVGLGAAAAAPPYLAVLAVLTTLIGSAELVVSVLLLAAVPLAGVSAYLAVRPVVASPSLRLWAGATYAVLPPVLSGVATGRLGATVLAVLLPPLLVAVGRAAAGHDRAPWAAGLLLAVVGAFTPVVLLPAALLVLLALPVVQRTARWRLLLVLAVPPVLLLPWLPAVLADPALLLRESGLTLPAAVVGPADLLLLAPGGPGTPPAWLTVALVPAALAALLRPDRRGEVAAGWALALAGLATAAVLQRVLTTTPWPGAVLLVAGAGLLLAAVVGAEGAMERVAARDFGWRQPAAAGLAAVAALTPVLLAGWWAVTGAAGPLERRDPVLLPEFVAADGAGPDRPRTLVLRAQDEAALAYTVLRAQGPRLGDAELGPDGDAGTGLGRVVADLASGRGGDAAARLVPYGVRYVLLTRPADVTARATARAVDAVPGMVRVSGPRGDVLWRVDYPTGRLRLLGPDAPVTEADGSPPPARVVPAGQVTASARVPEGPAGRLLVLADPVDDGWEARLDGRPMRPRSYDGWAQAFELPAAAGQVELVYDERWRSLLRWLQLAAVVVVVVAALPAPRTPDDVARRQR